MNSATDPLSRPTPSSTDHGLASAEVQQRLHHILRVSFGPLAEQWLQRRGTFFVQCSKKDLQQGKHCV